jgi:signal transduction histidine kinase
MFDGRWHIHRGVRWWLGTTFVVLVIAVTPLVALWLGPDRDDVRTTSGIVGLVLAPVALVAGVLLYFHWRMKRAHATAWLTAALIAAAVEGLTLAGTRMAFPGAVESHAGWLMVLDLAFILVALAMVTVLRHRQPPIDPALMGIGLGVLVTVVRFGLIQLEPILPAYADLLAVGNVVLVVLHVCFAWAVLHLGLQAPWANALPAAIVLLAIAHAVSYPMLDSSFVDQSALVANIAAAVLLSGTAVALLHSAIRDDARAVTRLNTRVAEVEQGVRADRERLHEINATIAGIATATRLMHDRPDMTDDCRSLLQDMLNSEIERLERLVDGSESPTNDVDLDRTIHALVVTQRAMGRHVDWEPSGLVTRGHADDITEVLTTLLNNAAQHAPGAPVSIATRLVGQRIEISVADRGPGVPQELADRIFDWGERSPDSRGQGIGLNVARRLTHDLGGSLLVVPAQPGTNRGAVFVMTLPMTPSSNRSSHGSAHARSQ